MLPRPGIKRVAGRSAPEDAPAAAAAASASSAGVEAEDELEFEDPYEDEEESEDEGEEEDDGVESSRMEEDSAAASSSSAAAGASRPLAAADDDDEDEDDDDDPSSSSVFLPGVHSVGEGEELAHDLSAYVMLHSLHVEWPCLSFDVMPDRLGAGRTRFPLSATIVAGTQADERAGDDNRIVLLRMNGMYATQHDDEDDGEEGEEDCDDDPDHDVQRIPHAGAVNRVRVMPQEPHIVASMADTGRVHLFDVRPQLRILDANDGRGVATPVPRGYGPVFTFAGHAAEGYAVDWSPTVPGRLVTGDCANVLHVWDVDAASAAAALGGNGGDMSRVWRVDPDAPYTGHSSSVEDAQWSPTETTVFATCSADGTVRIWDTRARKGAMITVQASDVDVNAISWSKLVSFLLASGDDAGAFKIWDLRKFDRDSFISTFAWHKGQITSIEWAYDDENVLTVASADNTCTLWDMSLEADEEAELALANANGAKRAVVPSSRDPSLAALPPQLLFMHGVRSQLKEVHFHKQLPGVMITTAADGFNVFKPDVVVTT